MWIIEFQPTLSLTCGLEIALTRNGTAPASTTVWANSILCLLISQRAEALICLRHNSDSSRHWTSRGTAPVKKHSTWKILQFLYAIFFGTYENYELLKIQPKKPENQRNYHGAIKFSTKKNNQLKKKIVKLEIERNESIHKINCHKTKMVKNETIIDHGEFLNFD